MILKVIGFVIDVTIAFAFTFFSEWVLTSLLDYPDLSRWEHLLLFLIFMTRISKND